MPGSQLHDPMDMGEKNDTLMPTKDWEEEMPSQYWTLQPGFVRRDVEPGSFGVKTGANGAGTIAQEEEMEVSFSRPEKTIWTAWKERRAGGCTAKEVGKGRARGERETSFSFDN